MANLQSQSFSVSEQAEPLQARRSARLATLRGNLPEQLVLLPLPLVALEQLPRRAPIPDVVVLEVIRIFRHLPDRIRLRAVCRHWKRLVESTCASLQCVKLYLTNRYDAQNMVGNFTTEWKLPCSINRFLFERNWIEPELEPSAKGTCTIREKHMNRDMIESFVRLFANVHTLVIYFTVTENEANVGYVVQLLRGLRKLDSFSFIQCHLVFRVASVERICSVVEETAPYTRLDLYFRPYPVGHFFYERATSRLRNALQIVNHFNLSYEMTNHNEMMRDIGWVHGEARRYVNDKLISHYTPAIISLSMQCTLSAQELALVFAYNRELQTVRQLQLYLIRSLVSVQNHLQHFTNVERLTLFYLSKTSQTLTRDWIVCLDTLPRLTELTLVNFVPDVVQYGSILRNIRKLTIGTLNLGLKMNINLGLSYFFSHPKRAFDALVQIIGKQFPRLEELNIISYDETEFEENQDYLEEAFMKRYPQLRLYINLRDSNLIDHL